MATYRPTMSEAARKSYSDLTEILKKISYKPGWKIKIVEEPQTFGFVVQVMYDGYESENAAFSPLVPEGAQAERVRERIAVSIGKTSRQPERRYFRRAFDFWDLERMTPEHLVNHVIADTIKQAEMFEFDRWFKFEGDRVFGEDKDNEIPFATGRLR